MMEMSADLRLLADLHATELTHERIRELQGIGFLPVASFPDELSNELLDDLASDFADIYLNGKYHTSPNESVWLDDEELICQQPMFEVRRCYERHELAAPNWRRMADDHLVNQLLFTAHLLDKAVTDSDRQVLGELAQFMDEHLLRWLQPFGQRVAQRCATRFYARLARETADYCEHLRDLLADILDVPRESHETIEARLRVRRTTTAIIQPMPYYPGMSASW